MFNRPILDVTLSVASLIYYIQAKNDIQLQRMIGVKIRFPMFRIMMDSPE